MNLLEAIATWLKGQERLPFGAVKSCPARQFWKPLACEDLDLGDRTAMLLCCWFSKSSMCVEHGQCAGCHLGM